MCGTVFQAFHWLNHFSITIALLHGTSVLRRAEFPALDLPSQLSLRERMGCRSHSYHYQRVSSCLYLGVYPSFHSKTTLFLVCSQPMTKHSTVLTPRHLCSIWYSFNGRCLLGAPYQPDQDILRTALQCETLSAGVFLPLSFHGCYSCPVVGRFSMTVLVLFPFSAL